jgi:hypothetical protein
MAVLVAYPESVIHSHIVAMLRQAVQPHAVQHVRARALYINMLIVQ